MLMALVVFSACEETPSSTGLLDIIPGDASFVVAIEYNQLITKGGLNNLKDYSFYKKLQSELSNQEPAVQQLVENFFKDSKYTGLDLERAFYLRQDAEKPVLYCRSFQDG